MKQKLTITIDRDLIPKAKRYARSRGLSLSALIEQSLKQATEPDAPSFTSRWRGQFKPADRQNDPRYDQLSGKYFQ